MELHIAIGIVVRGYVSAIIIAVLVMLIAEKKAMMVGIVT